MLSIIKTYYSEPKCYGQNKTVRRYFDNYTLDNYIQQFKYHGQPSYLINNMAIIQNNLCIWYVFI